MVSLWGNHQEAARKGGGAGPPHGIDGLPDNQHRHDGRFARAGRKFERDAIKPGVGVRVGLIQFLEDVAAGLARPGDLSEPDQSFHCFHLAKKKAARRGSRSAANARAAGRFPASRLNRPD